MTEQVNSKEAIQKRVLKEIKNRYAFAVGLIASFVILAFMVNQTLNRRMKEDFKTINLSGRQRMLSQRIALLTLRNDTFSRSDALIKFKDGLEFLLKTRFVSPDYPEVYKIYKGTHGLEARSREFLALSQATGPSFQSKEKIFALSQELLRKYEAVTYLKQYISESEFRNHLFLEIMILLINLFILLFEIIFIFRPMAKNIRETFTELNRMEEQSFFASRLALIGEIASSIGHEIRNPLFVARYHASKITSSDTDEERVHLSENIEKNLERINKILKALSVQAREASNDVMEDTPLANVIDDALEMFTPKLKYGNIDLEKSLNFEGNINCRYAAISQVIANLVSNAIDSINEYAPDHKSIRIESGQDDEGIFVRVTDSGPGVPPELTEKIFESFITTKKQGKGTGLGLPISKKIMQEHNGSLYLNTHISRSCFELRFPS